MNSSLGNRSSNGASQVPHTTAMAPVSTKALNPDYTPKLSLSFQHAWIERSNVTSGQALSHFIVEISRDGVTSYFCGWEGCRYPVGFAKRTQLMTHIRSIHLQEKPFLCTTWFVYTILFSRPLIIHIATPYLNANKMLCDTSLP